MKNNAFAQLHPAVNFIFFAPVTVFSLCIRSPLAMAISLAGAIACTVKTQGRRAVLFSLKFCLPVIILSSLINPLFNHRGVTVLCYLPSGNPLTAESIIYGISSGFMFALLMLWFSFLNSIFTSDKILYLSGRLLPSLSLLISMILKFIPSFSDKFRDVRDARLPFRKKNKLKEALDVTSVMINRSLEDAADTADNMKSRGYGTGKRTAFSTFIFTERDRIYLLALICCEIYIAGGFFAGAFDFNFYPAISCSPLNIFNVSFYFAYAVLCFIPFFINCTEDKKCRASHSEM